MGRAACVRGPLRSLLSPDSSQSLASPALQPAPPPPPPPQTELMTHSSPGLLLAASFCGRRNSSAAFPSPAPPPPTSLPAEEGFSEDGAGQRWKQRWRFHTLEGGAEPCSRFPVGSWGLSHGNAAIFLITQIFQTGRTGSAHLSRAPGSTPTPGTISVYSVDVLGWRDLPGDTADGKTERNRESWARLRRQTAWVRARALAPDGRLATLSEPPCLPSVKEIESAGFSGCRIKSDSSCPAQPGAGEP